MKNVIEHLLIAAKDYPERIALVEGKKKISFLQLHKEILQTVQLFEQKGIGPGDQVLIFVPVSIDLYRHVLALFYMGAVPVFIDQWVSLKRLKACMECLECKAIVASGKFLLLSLFIKKLNAIPVRIAANAKCRNASKSPIFIAKETDAALITFTTGTTGIPKAAIRTHQNLLAQFFSLSKLLDSSIKISLSTLPIVVLINIGSARTSILPSSQFKAKKPSSAFHLSQQLQENNVESIIASPSVFENIIQHASQPNTHIKELITGGGSVFPVTAQKIIIHFPAAKSQVVFGGTEAEPVSHIEMERLAELNADSILSYGLPVGKIAAETQLSIISYTENAISRPSEEEWTSLQEADFSVGEIVVAGPHVVAKYLKNNAAVLQNKIKTGNIIWHRTGDIAYRNEEDELFYYGRGQNAFMINGVPFYPMLLEYYIRQLGGISSFAILKKDKIVVAFICKKEKKKLAVIQTHLTEQKLLNVQFHFVKKVPMDKRHHTKVDYEALHKLID